MKIAIYGRSTIENLSDHVKELFSNIHQLEAELLVYEPFYNFLKQKTQLPDKIKTFQNHTDLKGNADYLLSLGGDGTLLETISFVRNSDIPVLGINTGRLGFLASVSTEEINIALDALVQKDFTLDERVLLRLETTNNLFGDVNYALNELTVLKKDSSSMITIHAYIDDNYLNSYWADGLIVATPTGSTAYSLSCGGPIVIPGSENFVITPIAPHNLNVRPIVISDKSVIRLKVEGRSPNYLVSLDSHSAVIDSSIELIIKKENFKLNLIKLKNQNFLNTIRNKLMWGLDQRN